MSSKPPRPPLEALLAVAAVSFAILAVEVGLTRSFSVLFRAPYVFLIVSGAIGGLGLGGLLVQFIRTDEQHTRSWVTGLCILLSAAIIGPVVWLFASPWGRDWVSQAELAIVLLLPMVTFSIAGMLISLVFRQYAASGGLLYFADLAAAAAAAPVSVLLLDLLGGINMPLLLGVLVAGVGLFLAWKTGSRPAMAAAAVTLLGAAGVFGSNLARSWITLPTLRMPDEALHDDAHPWHFSTKPLYAELAQGTSHIIRTDWTAVSRTDVVQDGDEPLYYIYTDGDVPTQMEPWDGKLETARREYASFIGSYPYRLLGRAPSRVLAVGSGGGLDVLLARAYGAPAVDAVEINPSIPRVVSDPRFAGTYARIYREPGVRLIVDEGRSFLQRSGKYDVIYFACAKTATTQTGGVALLDNNLYTVEAFRDYWGHLTDDGMAALVVQEPFLVDRLLITAWQALKSAGVADPGAHLLTARVPDARMGLGPYRYILAVRRAPWQKPELPRIREATLSNYLQPLYVPLVHPAGAAGAPLDPQAPISRIREALEAQYPVPVAPGSSETQNANLRPVTDDSPFYVDIARGINPTVSGLVWAAGVAVAVIIGVVLLIGWRAVRREQTLRPGAVGCAVLYFAMLGAGFILVELALMQRFVLLLGFPTRALSVSLFSLLISSALGAAWAQRGSAAAAGARLVRVLPVLVVALGVYYLGLAGVLERFLGAPLAVRVVVTALLMAPMGFMMGMPFPTALRSLSPGLQSLIPAFWSVNGVATIGASVLTMVLAKFVGYGGALLAGAACYTVAWVAFLPLRRRDEVRGSG